MRLYFIVVLLSVGLLVNGLYPAAQGLNGCSAEDDLLATLTNRVNEARSSLADAYRHARAVSTLSVIDWEDVIGKHSMEEDARRHLEQCEEALAAFKNADSPPPRK